MPRRARKPCGWPGCPELVAATGRYCPAHQDKAPVRLGSTARLYDYRWQRARRAFLAAYPLCVMCEDEGRTEPATQVDHIRPHKGDQELFWDTENWQGLCASHHSRKTGRESTPPGGARF